MKKTIIACFVLLALHSTPAFSQTQASHDEQDRFAQKMTALYTKSGDVELPDSVYRILKDFAFTTGQQQALILKQAYVIKMIYNKDISVADRIMICDQLIKNNSRPGTGIPVYLIQSMKTILTSQN